MSSNPLREMVKKLLSLQLITKAQMTECLPKSGNAEFAMLHLLEQMQQRGYLTPFQVERIKNLDYNGLVLGESKLLYENSAGSFARVYRASSIKNGDVVALKLLRNRWAVDPDAVELFKREAHIGLKLKHPNIVPLYEFQSQGDSHFFTMEFIEGGNLKDFLKIRGRLEPIEAVRYLIDIANGLEYALTLGYTHRDLKLSNILISTDGSARLIDFGLATDDEYVQRAAKKGIQQALEYTTLEEGTGAPRNDPRTDLFFLGCIAFELITGKPPFPPTKDRAERKHMHRYRNISLLSKALPDCPKQVSKVVDQLLNLQPENRYNSPTQLLAELQPLYTSLQKNEHSPNRKSQSKNQEPTILFVESRQREQDWLRNYFSVRGFRVLVLSNAERAITRIKDNPPECVVMIEDGIPKNAESSFKEAIQIASKSECKFIFLQSEKSHHAALQDQDDSKMILLTQPVVLREIRIAAEHLLGTEDNQNEIVTTGDFKSEDSQL